MNTSALTTFSCLGSANKRELYHAEAIIADALRSARGYLNVTSEEIESAIIAAGIEG